MSTLKENVDRTSLASLNRQTIEGLNKDISGVLAKDPEADISHVLEVCLKRYGRRKARREAASARSQTRGYRSDYHDDLKETMSERMEAEAPAEVIYPLDATVHELLEATKLPLAPAHGPLIIQRIQLALNKGEQLHPLHQHTVTRIHPGIVVKTSVSHNQMEIHAMNHIRRHSPNIPIPELLGAIKYDRKTYVFMSFIRGRTLEHLWPSLEPAEKSFIRDRMSVIMVELRGLPLPTDHLGCGDPPTCMDVRMRKRQSESSVSDEAEFNEFLLSTPRRRISGSYLDFLKRACLKDNHRIVMTHGDLTPRNILAERIEGNVQITGLIDWECSGAYPEYWEYIKALNTFSSIEDDDWCQFLPSTIGQYTGEWAKHLIIDKAIQ